MRSKKNKNVPGDNNTEQDNVNSVSKGLQDFYLKIIHDFRLQELHGNKRTSENVLEIKCFVH